MSAALLLLRGGVSLRLRLVAGFQPLAPVRLVRTAAAVRGVVPGAVLRDNQADRAARPAIVERTVDHCDAVARLKGEAVHLRRTADDRRRGGALEPPHSTFDVPDIQH